MDEVRRRGSAARMAYMKRFLSFILCVVLVAGLMEPPKAEAAFVVDDIYLIAAAFMASCGLDWVISGGGNSDAFVNSIAGLLDDYLSVEYAGMTVAEWAGALTMATVTDSGKLKIKKDLGFALSLFVGWVMQKFGIVNGSTVPVYSTPGSISMADGSSLTLSLWDGVYKHEPILGTTFSNFDDVGLHYFSTGYYFGLRNGGASIYRPDGELICGLAGPSDKESYYFFYMVGTDYFLGYRRLDWDGFNTFVDPITEAVTGAVVDGLSVSLSGADIDIIDTTTMTDDEAIEIGVGASAGVALDVLLEQILQAIMAGNLTATKEITQAATGEGTDTKTEVGDIALEDIQAQEQALGMVFISKFPFSIPWDVFKAVQLLAAPAEAPYWEVDFLAPMEHRVGAWQGDTTVVIDMGEYPIIGQVCRWASTFMFVWALMLGTKRLIWTA